MPTEPTQGKDYVFEYTESPVEMSVSSVADVHGNTLAAGEDYVVAYYKDGAQGGTAGEFSAGDALTTVENDGALTEGGAPAEPGTYFIVVIEGSTVPETGYVSLEQSGKQFTAQKFTISPEVPKTLDGVFAFDGDSKEDIADTTFTYTGEKQTVGFAIGTDVLVAGEDYDVTWSEEPKAAGSYTATLVGKGTYAGDTERVTIEVGTLDISNATIADVKADAGSSIVVKVGGVVVPSSEIELIPVAWTNEAGTTVNGDDAKFEGNKGKYTYLIQSKSDNITGSVQQSFNAVQYLKGENQFFYGEPTTLKDALDDKNFYLSDKWEFDADELSVNDVPADVELDWTLTRDGVEVDAADQPGEYTLTVQVPVDAKFTRGGNASVSFNVYDAVLSSTETFMAIDGKNVAGSESFPYTGEAYTPVITVKSGDNKLVAGTDYTVTTTVKVDGKDVEASEIKDAGVYTVTVEAIGNYDGEATFQVTVNKAAIVEVEVVETYFNEKNEGILYTGSAVTPTFIGHTEAAVDGKYSEKDRAFTLTADDYESVVYKKAEKEIKAEELVDAGEYSATITGLKGNFQGTPAAANFSIIEKIAPFTDVNANMWYAGVVAQADELEYMNGVEGTTFFLPETAINRAMVAQVIYNMAGATSGDNDNVFVDFDDISNEYAWAKGAIAFATAAEIITGYGPDFTSFGPGDTATREQIATMMYRYAKVAGIDTTVEDADAALAAYADGAQVSDWAKTAVAWAVEHEIMGVDVTVLNPQGDVLRAEVAAIATRVQPEAIKA